MLQKSRLGTTGTGTLFMSTRKEPILDSRLHPTLVGTTSCVVSNDDRDNADDGFSEGNTVLAFIPLVALVFLLFFGWICYRCCMVRHDEKVGVTEIMQDSRTIANTIRGKKKKPTVWGDLNNDPGLSSEPQVIE
ncbi:MAG: uncharacterized protein KVP18_000684 [Porospora cf. gigantea A]|uniref:uncharacterized protein n=1 Tax=Porospora cf. gigantea A TaxID=2853593 RepID=UPI00355A0F7D|nr:MAG: hypothetical protein KVP18_000684 [Porospora cf. gigantea A]